MYSEPKYGYSAPETHHQRFQQLSVSANTTPSPRASTSFATSGAPPTILLIAGVIRRMGDPGNGKIDPARQKL